MTPPGLIPRTWQPVLVFVLLTYAISSPFEYMAISAGSMGASGGLYALGGMWSPGTAALITAYLFKISPRSFGWGWGRTRFQVWSLLIPFFYCLAGYGLVWLLGLGGLNAQKAVSKLALLPLSIIIASVATLGEEIGWSGFLVPLVAGKSGFTAAALTRGITWSVWHYPMIIAGIYRNDAPVWFNLLCFTVLLTGVSFVFTWLRLKSGSLWTGTFLHSSHNVFIQSYFTPITSTTALTAYFIDEFGAALALLSIPMAFICWRMRSRLAPSPEEPPLGANAGRGAAG